MPPDCFTWSLTLTGIYAGHPQGALGGCVPRTYHLLEQWGVAFSKEHAEVQDLWDVEEEVVVEDFSKCSGGQEVFLWRERPQAAGCSHALCSHSGFNTQSQRWLALRHRLGAMFFFCFFKLIRERVSIHSHPLAHSYNGPVGESKPGAQNSMH